MKAFLGGLSSNSFEWIYNDLAQIKESLISLAIHLPIISDCIIFLEVVHDKIKDIIFYYLHFETMKLYDLTYCSGSLDAIRDVGSNNATHFATGSSSAPIDLTGSPPPSNPPGSGSAPVDLSGATPPPPPPPSNPTGLNFPTSGSVGTSPTGELRPEFKNLLEDQRIELGRRLRRIFETKPKGVRVKMSDHNFNDLEHKVIVKRLIDTESPYMDDVDEKHIGGCRYVGKITKKFVETIED